VPRVEHAKLTDSRLGESSAVIRSRVESARAKGRTRLAASGLTCNADMRPGDIRRHCPLDAPSATLLRTAMQQLQLSARAYHRVLKVARTIADLSGADQIGASHLAEALQYRRREG
jgi:magnesium chelatase family protein